jgi:hypothetical protein
LLLLFVYIKEVEKFVFVLQAKRIKNEEGE